jgi:hypothetical protein
MGVAAVVLLVVGVVLMVAPPLARDGICGLTACADETPDIAVTRTSPTEVAVLVPPAAARAVRSVQLLQGGSQGTGSRRWLIQRDGTTSPSSFPSGQDVDGFRTITELTQPPAKGTWTAQVGFGCTTASLPFGPDSLSVGEVTSRTGTTTSAAFTSSARTTETCASSPGGAEKVLLGVGAVLAVIGAVLGIVVVLRRPARFPEDPDDELGLEE